MHREDAYNEVDTSYGDEPDGIEDIEIIASGGAFSAAISFDASDKDRDAVMTAAFAAQFGLRSLDYTRRTYVEPYTSARPTRDPRQGDAIVITADAKRLVKHAATRGHAIRKKADHVGLFASGSALVRLPVSFRAVALTIRNGFHFESAVLMRLILEQLAWCYVVRSIPDGALFDTEPHKCITQLKRLLPEAGNVYGELSKSAHVMPAATLRYIAFKNGEPSVTLLSFSRARADALMLLLLADYYCVVSEFVFRDYFTDFRHIVRDSSGIVQLRPDRPGLQLLAEWRSKLATSEPHVADAV